MARIKVTGYVDMDESMVDRGHSSGLTQAGFEEVSQMTDALDDVDTEIV